MADNVKITVSDLFKKNDGKSGYANMYSIAKHIYQDDEGIVRDGFAIHKENLLILKAKIRAILIDELLKKKASPVIKRDQVVSTSSPSSLPQ
jgi:hypothetical protein